MKKLAITIGDPGGVGPEIIVKALSSSEVRHQCVPIVIGDESVLKESLGLLKNPLRLRIIKTPKDSKPDKRIIELIHVIPPHPPLKKGGIKKGDLVKGGLSMEEISKGLREDSKRNLFIKNKPTTDGGRACVSYIKKAVELALDKKVDGIVTAPISKEALKMAGF